MKEILYTFIKAFTIVLLPISVIYFLVWQSISFANLNRDVKKLSQKKEELYKKNYDLKSRIASTTSLEKIDNLYKKNNKTIQTYSGSKTITLTLPREKHEGEKSQK